MILTKETLSAGPKIGTGEGVAHSKRWYVALVRMHHEKKVAERLDKMGIENFVPVQQEVHQWSDRRKVVESVLLPMMVLFYHVRYSYILFSKMLFPSRRLEKHCCRRFLSMFFCFHLFSCE